APPAHVSAVRCAGPYLEIRHSVAWFGARPQSTERRGRWAPVCGSGRSTEVANRRSALQANIDLAIDEGPLLGRSQHVDEFVEPRLVGWRELEPCEEIEWLAEVSAVVQPSSYGGKVLQTGSDVARPLLEDCAAFVVGKRPPGGRLPYRNQRRVFRLGASEAG